MLVVSFGGRLIVVDIWTSTLEDKTWTRVVYTVI